VEKHQGTITFETETGKGTTFIIRLPLVPPSPARPPNAASSNPHQLSGVAGTRPG
jgi:hypothetical protein